LTLEHEVRPKTNASAMKLRRRDVKREEKQKKLLKLEPSSYSQVLNEPQICTDRAKRGRKPKKPVLEKSLEDCRLPDDQELVCSEKPMQLGLVIRDEANEDEQLS
jgi:hypothetical protein